MAIFAACALQAAPLRAQEQYALEYDVGEADHTVATPTEVPSRTSAGAAFTNFLAFEGSGDGDGDPKFAGKIDVYMVADLRDVGLWDGLTLNIHPEVFYGRTFNGTGNGAVLPVNTAMFRTNGETDDTDLAVNFTQRFGRASLTLGKMNMLERASVTPIQGGGGLEGFQHLQLAAPVSFNTPVYAFGGLFTAPVGRARFTVGLWDAEDATGRSGFEDPFATGVKGFATLTVPARIGGRPGFYGVTVGGTTAQGVDLNDIPDLILPPSGGATITPKDGGWQVRFNFQQFVWQDPANPARGWGLFGYASLWDGNPTVGRWSMAIGASGSPPIASRPSDRFGIGYFYFEPSGALIRGLAPILPIGAEQGVEAFYTAEIAGPLRVTANLQVIGPSPRANETALLAGLRTNLRF